MKDIIGVIISIFFVIIVIVFSEILKKSCNWGKEATRKFVHIGVAHWWLVAMYCIDNIYYAAIPPMIFIILNYISYEKQLIKSMERDGGTSDLGTVYFPVSLFILIILFWNNGVFNHDNKYIGAIGILIMGYGDGFAAIIGKRFGKRKYKVFGGEKSIEGSLTVFFFAFLITLCMVYNHTDIAFKIAIVIATLAVFIEALTPHGLDNLTLPIITSLCVFSFINIPKSNIDIYYKVALGITISSFIAIPAYYKKSLKMSGCFGAIVLGTVIYITSSSFGIIVMLSFFISSSLLSHFKKSKKNECAKLFDKTGNRDALQVFANGGVGLIFSIVYFFTGRGIYLICMCIAFAASNADTWATELGILNKKDPVSLRTLRRVKKGTSGAISLLGSMFSMLGAIFIALISVALIKYTQVKIIGFSLYEIFIFVSIGGFLGCFIDSLLGATVQGIYYSEELNRETEKKVLEGKKTKLVRGFEIFNNDVVNFLSIALASILILLI
ncbi:DUF92 domain-containing protein [Clostridiaceae bacterium M8S5]|nr:DUF92 domain-containing protein [Clostridiaceae bacterium M8S5]